MRAVMVVRMLPRLMTTHELAAVRRAFPVFRDRDPKTRCFTRSLRGGIQCQRAWLHYGRCSFPRRSRAMLREMKQAKSNLWWRGESHDTN